MAATSPNAVASKASAMPGATTARLVVWDLEIPMNAFMMPQTVPNRPTNGAVAPIVASMPMPREICRAIAASTRSSRNATRSLNPVVDAMPSDSSASRAVDRMSCATASLSAPQARTASVEAAAAFQHFESAACKLLRHAHLDGLGEPNGPRRSDAKASPIITAFTTISALRNIPKATGFAAATGLEPEQEQVLP